MLEINGARCLAAFIVSAVLLTSGCSRVVLVARNIDAVFDGADAADRLNSVDALVDFIDANRSRVSLVAYRPGDPDAAILLNPDALRPLGSTIKILVLAGYAEAVDQGRWSPDERVPLAAVEAFLLPRTDGGAHDRAVENYRERGWLDASGSISLRDVVWAMMTVSDNAATDYLLHRLGREDAQALPARFAARDSDAPMPISGVFLSWSGTVDEPLADSAWELAGRLRSDPGFRARRRSDPVTIRLTLREQAGLSGTRFPGGTARDYASLMERVQGGALVSAAGSATMREFLEWPMENERIRSEFTAFGTKGGGLPGVLTEATYAAPRHAGPSGVVALFFDKLPLAVWFMLIDSYLHQDFLRQLLSDPDFFEDVRQRLSAPSDVRQLSAR